MKDLIRNILRETVRPEWLKDFESKSREGRVEHIENNIARNRKLMPKIIEFLESKLGDNLIVKKYNERLRWATDDHDDCSEIFLKKTHR